ncbi:hypothetical protein PENANT_c019G00898 [Penicillium antarcticum]|uniref:Crh-like protein n=1 Tax=Penicillium antarcticum TaxID=416450 RepID=A0A1V6Q0X0_9EURO|nr:uncharacterized protein N7508_001167 [Penicillium antarcticum]KAJ5316659.1 hypothetical protein N7508_001167 [Penicillium antarcticum]OQD82881.1 hypothetical protein PENANT_c019G00898 [Penicillium antarcticum]
MRFALAALGLLSSTVLVTAQTYTDCNPTQRTCPADPAFGQVDKTFDFTSGASDAFKSTGAVTYDDENGATFTISKQGDGPLIQSGWYIMFGRVEFTIKVASGTGIVSSAVLQSDCLDELDWEWLGGKSTEVQSNYFGKGDTSTYNRGAFHSNPGNQDSFHTYSIDWTSSQIVWAIDGETVRALTPESADAGQYPQTPMMVKVGVWAGGDSNNAQGTIDWAGGQTDYSQGPFKMYLKKMTVTDYSTGTSYKYGDTSGTWESIISEGGEINGNSGAEPSSTQSAPSITATADGAPVPWSGTHKETSSWVTPNVWPWVASDSPTASSTGYQYDWESRSSRIQTPGGATSENSHKPVLHSTTKIAFFSPQSTFHFTFALSHSSSVAFSRSGIETVQRNSTRMASKTRVSTKYTTTATHKPTDNLATNPTTSASATASEPRATSTTSSANVRSKVPAFAGVFCTLFVGAIPLL